MKAHKAPGLDYTSKASYEKKFIDKISKIYWPE